MKKLLLLFDIDGTLLRSGGAGQLALEKVVCGETGANHQIKFSGRTDRGIFGDFFKAFDVEDTDENFAEYCTRFLPILAEYLGSCDGRLLPNVHETLECLNGQDQAAVGLLTGNIRAAAKLKLSHYDLVKHFYQEFDDAVGGFGDSCRDRDDVARQALAEARQRFGVEFDPADTWVIGDTPNDVKCARAIGANVIAVATGSYTLEQLQQTDADLVVSDLNQADEWWGRLAKDHGVTSPIKT